MSVFSVLRASRIIVTVRTNVHVHASMRLTRRSGHISEVEYWNAVVMSPHGLVELVATVGLTQPNFLKHRASVLIRREQLVQRWRRSNGVHGSD